MTLQKELQINIVMSNYNQRSSNYSSNYDYILLDNLLDTTYSSLFRFDLKNLKIKDLNNNDLKVLYLPKYGSQSAAILVRIPTGKMGVSVLVLIF